MTYFVKRIAGGNYANAEFVVKLGTEVEVTEEQYKYLNDTFGTSGHFTFRTSGLKKTTTPKVVENPTPKKEVEKKKSTKQKKVPVKD